MSVISGSALILGKKQPEPTAQEKQSEAYELAHRRLGSNTYAPPSQVQRSLPKTSVGLALKVYPVVGGFLESIGQSFVNLGLEELDIIQYNVATPEKALGAKLPSYPISEKEKKIQQEKTDVAIFTLSTAAFAVAPTLIPVKLAGSTVASVAARTLLVSGIGAGTGYIYGGVEGAKIGALTAGIMYLGSVGTMRGLKSLYHYIRPKPLENYGLVDVTRSYDVAPEAEGFMKGKIVEGEYVGEGLTTEIPRPEGMGSLEGFMKGEIVKGKYVGEGLTHELPRPSGTFSLEGFMKGEIVKGEYIGEGLTHALERPKGFGDLSFARLKSLIDLDIPLTGQEQFVVEKAIFVEPKELPTLKGWIAERTATGFGTMPKTALLDPETLFRFERPEMLLRNIPYLPTPELTAKVGLFSSGFLPKLASVSTVLGFQALMRSTPTVSPLVRGLPKLDSGLDLTPDVATSLELSPLTAQSSLTEQMAKVSQIQIQRQIPRTIQDFPPEFVQLKTPRFARQTPFTLDFTLSKSSSRKKGAWEKRYMWEFPVKGPKELWKVV